LTNFTFCSNSITIKYGKGLFIDSSRIDCVSPSFPVAAMVVVSVEQYLNADGRGTMTESLAHFNFVHPAKVKQIFPEMLPFNQHLDSHDLLVHGTHFIKSSELSCLFEYTTNQLKCNNCGIKKIFRVSAIFHNSSLIECQNKFLNDTLNPIQLSNLSPTGTSLISTLKISITTNGVEWTKPRVISSLSNHKILAINPKSGMSGTNLFIKGESFLDVETLSCKFGHLLPLIRADFRSTTEIICKIPEFNSYGTLQVAVTNNGFHFSNSSDLFKYIENIVVDSIEPSFGQGGTHVIIRLQKGNIEKETSSLCRFNQTIVSASFVSSITITCIAPLARANGGSVPGKLK